MDVDELTKKYALQSSHEDSASKKRRAHENPVGEPAGSKWTTDFGAMQKQSQAKHTSSASTDIPKAKATGAPAPEEKGKGGKGKGKGKNREKGKGKGSGKANTTEQILSTHAKAILRLEQERRDRDRQAQWAVDFQLPCALPNIMQNVLTVHRANRDKQTENVEGKEKPENPRYRESEDGSLSDIQWKIFAGTLFTEAQLLEQTNENHEALAKVLRFLRETVYHEGESGPDRNKTACLLIKPAHRINEDSKTWTWVFRFRTDTSRGREVHEQLLTCHQDFKEYFNKVSIRKDRAPKDGLTKAIENQLESLRI